MDLIPRKARQSQGSRQLCGFEVALGVDVLLVRRFGREEVVVAMTAGLDTLVLVKVRAIREIAVRIAEIPASPGNATFVAAFKTVHMRSQHFG